MKWLSLSIFSLLFAFSSPAEESRTIKKYEAAKKPATVLLITDKSLSESWNTFANWKTSLGKATKIITVQDIIKEYKGVDTQQKIRECVLSHVEKQNTRWVILGGDSDESEAGGLVPDRDTPHGRFTNPMTRRPHNRVPADLYYVSPRGKNWDANKDGIYGDWKNDKENISYQGVCPIARIPLRTTKDVKAYTEKVIAYETKFPEKKFATQFMFGCAVSYANYKGDLLWDTYLSKAWKGSCYKFLTNKTPWDSNKAGDYQYTPDNLVEKINENIASKIHLHGHGHLPSWVLESHKSLTKKKIKQLKNSSGYLLMTTVSCHTGEYDNNQDPSIVEAILRQPQGGAVAVVAPSRIGVPIFENYGRDPRDKKSQDGTTRTLTLYWKHGLSENLTTGEAFMKAKYSLQKENSFSEPYHWCQTGINLLGDPTLDMRAKDPSTPKVTWPTSAKKGKQTIKLNTEKPGITVCLWKGDEVYQVLKSDDKGKLETQIDIKTPGELSITVSGPSLNTVQKKFEIK